MLQKRNSEREEENGDRSERSRLVETIKIDQRIFVSMMKFGLQAMVVGFD